MGPRKQPLVYLDACCFGVEVQAIPDVEAIIAFRSLKTMIEFGRLRFADSTWLRYELRQSEPASKVRKLLSLIPASDIDAIVTPVVKRVAKELSDRLGMKGADKGLADCRHLASAISVGCDYLVTFDAEFYEAVRQHPRIVGKIRPVWLRRWQEEIHEFREQG